MLEGRRGRRGGDCGQRLDRKRRGVAEAGARAGEVLTRPVGTVVAYVSSDAELAFRAGDTLIVNASDEAIHTGPTSAVVIPTAVE